MDAIAKELPLDVHTTKLITSTILTGRSEPVPSGFPVPGYPHPGMQVSQIRSINTLDFCIPQGGVGISQGVGVSDFLFWATHRGLDQPSRHSSFCGEFVYSKAIVGSPTLHDSSCVMIGSEENPKGPLNQATLKKEWQIGGVGSKMQNPGCVTKLSRISC